MYIEGNMITLDSKTIGNRNYKMAFYLHLSWKRFTSVQWQLITYLLIALHYGMWPVTALYFSSFGDGHNVYVWDLSLWDYPTSYKHISN